MKRREIPRRCQCPCNRELPWRYKGREKIFFDSSCRKTWHAMTLTQQKQRNNQMKIDLEKEKK
jgi:hypothetical protein